MLENVRTECPVKCSKFQPRTGPGTDQVVAIDTSILFLQPGDLVRKRLSECSKEMNKKRKHTVIIEHDK